MNSLHRLTCLAGLLVTTIAANSLHAATQVVGDTYTVTASGTGFALNKGVNTGINPPTTRLTGTAAANLRYINTGTKATNVYTITSNKLRVTSAVNPGRFVLSSDGTTAYNFASALGTGSASAANPIVYDLSISMNNGSTGTQRFSFALGTAEGDATTWSFGFQVYRATSTDTFYTIGKRIDMASSGLASDLNAAVKTMAAGTYGTEITILMRVTDAGSESSTYNSRVQLSLDNGATWFYDTASDANLTNGWRLNGAGRVIMWDVAPDAGPVTYDNFSLNWNSGPRTWTGAGANGNWSTGANWGGISPSTGNPLIFNGAARLINTNDISGLTVPWVTFNNGGFSLYGNTLTATSGITNVSGVNTLRGELAWSGTGVKTWNIASGTELTLNNTNTIEVGGDHTVVGGGTLRVGTAMNIGVATTANPAFIINEGKHIIDGGNFTSRGGYRIGSLATGAGAQTIISNGATFTLTSSGANLRVGDSANPVASQLFIDNSTVNMAGGILALPYVAGATGTITQSGGTVSGCILSFNDSGAGTGTYTIKDGTLAPIQIQEGTSAGTSTISFDNATLQVPSGAAAAFMSGLNSAQIQSRGLTIDAGAAVTIAQPLSGSGALTKIGTATITLNGANTYSGPTTISVGTLALGAAGSINNSPSIVIANGTTFDVSAVAAYAVRGNQTLSRTSMSGVGTVNGSVTLNAGAQLSFVMNGTNGNVGTLAISGGLTLNTNIISINVTGQPLGVGTYTVLTYTGSKTGSFNPLPVLSGFGTDIGLASTIVETPGQIAVKVYVPAHSVAAGNIKMIENDLGNRTDSVSVSTTLSINGFQIRDGSSRGDVTVQIGTSATDDLANGVLMSSVAENGRDHGEDSGTNFCTSAISFTSSGYFIPIASAPSGAEYNINVSAAWFPYSKWLGGYARNSAGTNGGPNDLLTGSPSLTLGTHFVDNGDGTYVVNLNSFGIDSRTDGVLLVTEGSNQDKFALTSVNTNNGTWTVYVKDNGTNGSATERDPVAFVFVPKTNISVISGKFAGDGTIQMYNGNAPRFSVTNVSTGTWKLTIPGYSPTTGVLLISEEGPGSLNLDNIISYQASGSSWLIQSRDLPGLGLQALTDTVASFVFIPAPTATLIAPSNGGSVSTAPNLTVRANDPAGGNLAVTFYGHRAAVPGPGPDFLIPVLPDTQNYAREASSSGQATRDMWYAQTDWIVNHRVSDNIPFIATLGDCVQNGDILNGNPNTGEWKIATNAYYRVEKQSTTLLLEGIPYGVSVGNHDQDPNGDPDGTTDLYNQYFGTSHYAGKSYYGGHYSSNNDSWFDLFSAGGMDFIVISFEYGRYGSGILDWANAVLATNQTRRVIVLTHHAGDDTPDDTTVAPFSAQGQAIYDALKTNPNFFLMLGGHVFNEGGEGRRSDTYNGHTVRTLISDYQGRFNGGNGLMRLMYFSPSNNLVSVKTYSPYTGNYETDANSQFSFTYNMQPNGAGAAATAYIALATNLNVAAGTQTSNTWSGLVASKTYEWYVTVANEAGDYSTSTEWQFKTTSGFSGMLASDSLSTAPITDSSSSTTTTDAQTANISGGNVGGAGTGNGTGLKIISAASDKNGHVTLTWTSIGGQRYRVQASQTLDGAFSDIVRDAAAETDGAASGVASTQTFIDNVSTTNNARFYRVKVVP